MDLHNKPVDDILDYIAAEKDRKWSRDDAKAIVTYVKDETISWEDRYNVIKFVCTYCTDHGNAMLFDSSQYPSLYKYLEKNRKNYKKYIT